MKKRLITKGFAAAQIDEVNLHEFTRSILENTDRVDIGNGVDDIFKEHGLDVATSLLYQQTLASKHADFIHSIDSQQPKALPFPSKQKVKCLIIPGMLYLEHPEAGSDGELIAAICKRNHFETEVIETNSTGTISENKQIIKKSLKTQTHQNIWLISISKGTADLRVCLQESPELTSMISGWISFSGIFSGSTLASSRINTFSKKLFFKILCKIMNINYALIEELKPEHQHWKQYDEHLQKIKLIHIIGFPLLSHVQPLIAHRFKKLSQSGPTDGMIDLQQISKFPGDIYPMWGCDHFLRSSETSTLLYKLCQFISKS